VWQALRSELHPHGLEVVTVALDVDPEKARPFIEAAEPEHPSLIDRAHVVDELFGIVNVPNSVWIDEEGMIVRPVDVANVQPSIAARIKSGALKLPDDMPPLRAEIMEEAKKIRSEPETYLAALRDWVEKGAESEWARTPDEVIERSEPRSRERAEAAVQFELGEYLHERGQVEAAQRHWREAHRLYPENWTYKRQAWELVSPGTQTRSDVYDSSWLDDIRALGADEYYPALRP
jgi:tetratricopeptide (TPR) repeat protein